MVETLTAHVKRAAKAYVAVAAPIVTNTIAELATELNSAVAGLVSVLVGAVVVFLVPNSEA